jgi:hypothetical protein
VITLDGNDGLVYAGTVATVSVPDDDLVARLHVLRQTRSAPEQPAHKARKHHA